MKTISITNGTVAPVRNGSDPELKLPVDAQLGAAAAGGLPGEVGVLV